MFPPFPEEPALPWCRRLVDDLRGGALVLERQAPPSPARAGQGVMLGVLVCTDGEGRTVVLEAPSGISRALVAKKPLAPEVRLVPPVVSGQRIQEALSKNDAEIHRLTAAIAAETDTEARARLVQGRTALTTESLARVHALYRFACADGTERALTDICAESCPGRLPPTGTGDCCAPKLLHYAFRNGLQPLGMAEFFHDPAAPDGRELHAPCDERCALILPAMLGLRILYRDGHFAVVDKQSGVLSVPGRGPEKQDSVETRLRRLFPGCIAQPAVHRLDMETSGLLALAFTKEAHRTLGAQFAEGTVRKAYTALLDGVLAKRGIPPEGRRNLFFRLDVEHRPHQVWDAEHGKRATTEWRLVDVERYHAPDGTVRDASRVEFFPLTGRTHQLRLLAADGHGFGIPIIGDTLYGTCRPGERLLLHAHSLSLLHPATGERMEFRSPPPF